jgi:hypothetical protein
MPEPPKTYGAFQLDGKGVRFTEITDGLSNTLMVGEKHVPRDGFGVGWLDSSAYNGDYPASYTRGGGNGVGLAQSQNEISWKFGSYHTAVCQFVMCDGSVRGLFHSIDPYVLGLLAQRNDGQVIPDF